MNKRALFTAHRWLLFILSPILVPLAIAVWLVWYILTIPQMVAAIALGLAGHQGIAAWLWNHSAMVLFDRERDLG